MIRVRVQCINKSDRSDPDERIRYIGGVHSGDRWKLEQQDAIRRIQAGEYSFYVEEPAGDVVDVIVARSARGNLYLKTSADGDQPNNLLALPECP